MTGPEGAERLVSGRRGLAAAVGLVAMLSACAALTDGGGAPAAHISAGAEGAGTLLYVTDRGRVADDARVGSARYGHDRSASMAFGTIAVDTGAEGAATPHVRVGQAQEAVRFPTTPVPFTGRDGIAVPVPALQAAYDAAGAAFKADVGAELRARGQHEVILFVHGFHNDFDDSAASLAGLWDAAGQFALPIVFSWPADNPSLFGYFRDRESGEFSVFHFKETLRLLGEVAGLDHIQVVAHSRGTDVATSALREMVIAARAAGQDPRRTLRIENLVLAAPDLDIGVVRQRLIAEHFSLAFGAINVYMNPTDGALGFAQMLMSGTRFGRLSYGELSADELSVFGPSGNVFFINVSGVERQSSHGYFRDNPRVLADIVTVLRTSAVPGHRSRDLVHEAAAFWRIEPPPRPIQEQRSRDDRN